MKWSKELQKAEKFLKNAHEHGDRVYERYQDKREDMSSNIMRANLFYSGVQTLRESLFNSLPKADVSRMHKDAGDDVSRVACLILQRALDYEIQCAEDFRGAVRAAILDRLVPGVGTVWCRFEVDTQIQQQMDPLSGEVTEIKVPVSGTERLYVDNVYWKDLLWSPARAWRDIWWVGRRHPMTKDEIIERWGEDAFNSVQAAENRGIVTPKEITEGKYDVWEIWNKNDRTVTWTTKSADEPFEEVADPYKLSGFYPTPQFLLANPTTTAYLPVTDYHQSQDQYLQLDELYARISCIIRAIKVAGIYDASNQGSIGTMLQSGENKLVPVENWAMLKEAGGAGGCIEWYPVEQVASVLQMLQTQYEAIKAVLFEVSGLSDIQRGVSNQYETAEAQKIKAQFASTRMGGYQRDVAEFVTGILQIMGELVVQLYSDNRLGLIVGMLDEADLPLVPQALNLLRNDELSSYRISVQADSLVQADWALEKGQRMELLGFISQFLQSAVPAMQQDSSMGPLLLTLFKFTVAGYRGGAEVEGAIDRELDRLVKQARMPKPPPPPSPEQIKAQAEAQKSQTELQIKDRESQQRIALEQQQFQADSELASQKLVQEIAVMRQEMQMERERFAQEMQMEREKFMLEMANNRMKMSMEQDKCDMQMKMQEAKADNETGAEDD